MNLANANIVILLLVCVILHSCSSTKKLAQEESLIIKQSFVLNGEEVNQDPVLILSQTPENQRIFGVPFKLHLYNLSESNPEERFETWLNKKPNRAKRLNRWLSPKQVEQIKKYKVGFSNWIKKTGENPSLVNAEKIALTNSLFTQYYNNLGYFNATSTATVEQIEPQKSSIQYKVKTGAQFILDSITNVAGSKDIDSIYKAHQSESILKQGNAFKVENINAERERLINVFRNNGIFNFQQRSIRFKAFKDSLGVDTKIPLVVEIKNAQKRVQDSLVEVPYKVQKIRSLSIYVENPEQDFSVYTDSVNFNGFKIFSVGPLKYKPNVLVKGVQITPDQPYSYQDRTTTYRYFNELQNFKYPTISYEAVKNAPSFLDANVFLSPRERFSLGFNFDVSHSNIQDVGITLGSSVISRNIFRGAEILEFGIKSTVGSSRDVAEQKSTFFNLFEVGGNLLLRVPRLLAPEKIKTAFFKKINVKTNISLGISLQENIGLDRQSFTGNFEYQWKTKPTYTYTFKLADIEYVDNKAISNYFNVYRNSYDRLNNIAQTLPSNNSPYLNEEGDLALPTGADLFINHVLNQRTSLSPEDDLYTSVSNINERKNRLTANNFIVGSSFSFTKNNQESIVDESFSQFRVKLEWVGNLLNGLLNIMNSPKDSNGNRFIFNLAPTQYFKSEISYIKHWEVGRERILAFRGFTGVALPYGNSNSIPFTRSYYAGGSNDNRAWKAYKLGPGSSNGINEFNEANFKIALNLEYRYPILGPLKGAFFIDAGNIWNINNNVPDPKQNLNNFRDLNQLAVGTGVGLRYDFDYFIFRLDTAFKTFDPSQAPEDRWGSQIALKKAVFNVGINYPF